MMASPNLPDRIVFILVSNSCVFIVNFLTPDIVHFFSRT